MAEKTIRGINCPACGGSLEISEGTIWLRCSFCGTGLLVHGDAGIRRFYLPMEVPREQVLDKVRVWLRKFDKARDLKRTAAFTEVFPVYVPFWRVTGRVIGWVLGDVKKASGKNTHYVPAERKVFKDFEYTCPACDIGDFGVRWIDLSGDQVLPFDLEAVQKCGMTFEVLTTGGEVVDLCDQKFAEWGRDSAGVSRVTFSKLHTIGRRCSIVFYPLWVIRYEYENRTYQITADAESGNLLFGRAPGNNAYRVVCLLASAMLSSLIFTSVVRSGSLNSSDDFIGLSVLCLAILVFGYMKFRYGGEIVIQQKARYGHAAEVDASQFSLAGARQMLKNVMEKS
jgi:hypothetical protein